MPSALPLISIIVPVYNAQSYLRKCLDSIRIQTYKNLEVLLADDCSTDSSGYICDEYAHRDKRFYVLHLPHNVGSSGARNKLLDICKGDILGFIDDDDWVEPDYVETLYHTLGTSDMALCGHYVVYGDKQMVSKHLDKQGQCTTLDYLRYLLDDEIASSFRGDSRLIVAGYLWNKLFRRKYWGDIRFEGDGGSDDSVATTAYICSIKNINYIPDCKYYHRILANSDSHKLKIKKVGDFVWVRTRQRELITNYTDDSILHSKCNLLIWIAYYEIWNQYYDLHLIPSLDYTEFLQRMQQDIKGYFACLRYVSLKMRLKSYLLYYAPSWFYRLRKLKERFKN